MPPRPHPLATARAADWADRAVGALWRKGITAKPPLDPEYLWQVGSRGFAAQDEHAGRSEAEVADFRLRLWSGAWITPRPANTLTRLRM